jgi:hypothetical protein
MKERTQMNTLSLQFKKVTALCLIVFALGCLALFARSASGSPATEEGYPGSNIGDHNTAIGEAALAFNQSGVHNRATGGGTLQLNTAASDYTATSFGALFNNLMGLEMGGVTSQ